MEVVLAWPERYLRRELVLPEGATVADAVAAAALDPGGQSRAVAVHGVLARPQQAAFYRQLDPTNTFNPGIGQTSRLRGWGEAYREPAT